MKIGQGVATWYNDLGIKEAGRYRLKACLKSRPTVCATSNMLEVAPSVLDKVVLFGQPSAGTVFPIFNARSGTARITPAVNVTFADGNGNRGAQAGFSGLLALGSCRMNVTCDVEDKPVQVATSSAQWTQAQPWCEFLSMGKIREGIESITGKGSVGAKKVGYKCFGTVFTNLVSPRFVKDIVIPTFQTNEWTFKA